MSSDNVDRIFRDIAALLIKMVVPRYNPLPPDVRAEIERINAQLAEFTYARHAQLRMLGLEGFVTV